MGNQYTHVNLPGRLRSRELFFEYLAGGHVDVGARLTVPTRNGEGGLPGVPSCIICFGRNHSYHGDLRDAFGGYEKMLRIGHSAAH